MPAIFEVAFNTIWDNGKPDCLSKDSWDDSAVVAAEDTEDAIKKVKAANLKVSVKLDEDDDGKILKKPRITKITGVVIHHVDFVRTLDIL